MPCLTTLSIAPRRPLVDQPTDSHGNDRQRQAFQQCFTPMAQDRNPAPNSQTSSQGAHPDLELELAPYQARLANLGQFTQSTLTLKLTNGPLAGLEICARAQACTLLLQVRTLERERLEHIAGPRSVLESKLALLFDRPVTLEIHDALATIE